jgi:hypothetical protein
MVHATIRSGELRFIILWFCRLFTGGFFLLEGNLTKHCKTHLGDRKPERQARLCFLLI